MLRYAIKGWVFASTFCTLFNAARELCQLYPDKTNTIMVTGILLNIAINYGILKYFDECKGP